MNLRFFLRVVAAVGIASQILPANAVAGSPRKAQVLKGYITDSWCGVNRDTKPPSAECTRMCVKTKGAKYAFYDLADGKLYLIKEQSRAQPFAGNLVLVEGVTQHSTEPIDTMRGKRSVDTISLSSIKAEK